MEILLGALAEAIVSIVVADLAQRPGTVGLQEKLRGDSPERLAIHRALDRAYAAFSGQFPNLAAAFFDEYVLKEPQVAEQLARLLIPNQQPDKAILAQVWSAQFGAAPPVDLDQPLTFFLETLEDQIKAEPALKLFVDRHAFDLSSQGNTTEQVTTFKAEVEAAQQSGDLQQESAALGNLGLAYRDLGQMEQAIAYHQQALAIHREIGDRQGEAHQLGNLGIAHSILGQEEAGIEYFRQALAIYREIGHRRGEAGQLGNLALAFRAVGQVEQAIAYQQQALAIDREIGYRLGEAHHLANLGLVYCDLGQVEQAKQYLQQALAIFEEIKSPEAGQVRKQLADVDRA
jgi:tetratricopeptide (TPR) repeat protein